MATDTHSTHRNLPGFLRLSPELRHSIYHLLWSASGVIESPDFTSFSFRRSMPDVFDLCGLYDTSARSKSYSLPPDGFYGLLLSCRTIYAETSALLYSSNHFFCYYEASHSLAPLRELRAESVASMTNLKIVLNQASCHSREGAGGSRRCDDGTLLHTLYYENQGTASQRDRREGRYRSGCDAPLRRSDASTRSMVIEWYKTAAHLGPLITPGQLELSFVCDVYSRDTLLATMILDAFRHFPPLKDCHIRLSRTPNPALRNLARDAVLKARGIQSGLTPPPCSSPSPSPTVSRLTGLPRELRLRILEYTDLVTPLKEVMWAKSHASYLASRPFCPSPEGRGDHKWAPEIHHGCQFSGCSERPYPDKSLGCYCQLTHAAASSTCRCWATPTPLFLVSRTLRQDANLVFFAENRFVVIDSTSLPILESARHSDFDQNHRLAVSQFLRDVVPMDCLGYLRFVEIVFPPYIGGQWPLKGDPVYKDWAETVSRIKDKLNLPALTIRMLAVHDRYQAAVLTHPEAKQALEGYFHVLRPLTRLGGRDGLARFYAQLAWPWRRTETAGERIEDWDDEREMNVWMTGREFWLKERAERLVLGVRYDRARLKAQEPRESAWRSILEHDY